MKDIKKDFPVFENNPGLVYLDSCSSTQKPSYVIEGVSWYVSNYYANIHRWLYNLSEVSEEIYQDSKKLAGNTINAKSSEIIYTYNSTYGLNMLAYSLLVSGWISSWDKILVGIGEHHSNIVPWLALQQNFGVQVEFFGMTKDFDIDFEDFSKKYDNNVKLVAANYVSNVTWSVFDIKKLSGILREDTLLVIDGSQAVPNFRVDVKDLDIDFFVFTWHKIMGYSWIGVLYWKKELIKKLTPAFGWGGSIQDVTKEGYRSLGNNEWFEFGTPNIISAASLKYAFEYIESIGWYDFVEQRKLELVDYALEKFRKLQDKIKLIGKDNNQNRVGVFSFVFRKDFSPVKFWEYMAMKNICIRCGGHCAHPYLEDMGYQWVCRMSLYIYNDFQDIDKFFEALEEFYDSL